MNIFARTQEICSRYLCGWAFDVSLDGDSVRVNHGNVSFLKSKLEQHGLEDVRVYSR